MAELEFNPKSMSGNWVFYNRLKEDGYVQLYNAARNGVKIVGGQKDSQRIVNQLYTMAENEVEKECKLLNKVFGVKLKIDTTDRNFYLQLIQSLNEKMNLKSVYQRNIARIKEGESQISIAQLFPSYFVKEWNKAVPKILEQLNLERGKTIVQKADKVLTRELPKIIQQTLIAMFNSKDFSQKNEETRAYQDLIKAIEQQGINNELAKNLYNLYHLDELKNSLLKAVKTSSNRYKKQQLSKFNVGSVVGKDFYSDGGLSLEYIENYIINNIVANRSKNYSIAAVHTGKKEIKADNIIGFNVNIGDIESALETSEKVSRERNIRLLSELENKIKYLDDSFIVYSNAKNYSISKNFHGFSSGSSIKLETMKNILSLVQNKSETLITAIMNTLDGAVGKDQKGALEDILATDIAYFLFDDVKSIGVPQSGITSLHIFDLDGIYIPLSYLLWELAESIQTGLNNPHLLVKVSIKSGEISFPDGPFGMEQWRAQRTSALQEIEIRATFLQNFRDIIQQL